MIIVSKKSSVLNFKKDKPTVYKLQQQQQPAVDFNALAKEISASCGVGTAQTKSVIEALIDRMVMFMSIGHAVKLGDFGTFKPVISVRTVTNADDADASTVKSKKIRFYPGKRFKQMLSEIGVSVSGPGSTDDEDDSQIDETPLQGDGGGGQDNGDGLGEL